MKKLILIIPFCLLVLSSCNFPLINSATVSASEVSTRVAQTLQAAANTSNPTVTNQPVIPLGTTTPTKTAIITPTATTSPDDPRLTLGSPTFTDSFTSGSGMGLKTPYSDGAITMSIENGGLLMVNNQANAGIRWRLEYLTPRNFYLEGTFKTITCSGSDFYGLVSRSPNYTDGVGYYFGISCAGQYSFMRYDGSNLNTIIDWTSDPALITGENQENRIGIMFKDDQMTLYINGKLIQEASNDVLKLKGHYGVFQSAIDNPTMTVEVEEINEWDLP